VRSERDLPGAAVSLTGIGRRYGDTTAVADVTLHVAPGEFMTFLGPSGSGKTTTLSMIAGFVEPTAGTITIGDDDLSRVPPHKRGIGMVFQHYALFPHMSVADNVAYPLKQRRLPAAERNRLVKETLALVHLEGFANRRPHELSGGQQQRVALARALVYRPPVLLMDEPLGALDRRLREALQLEIKRIHQHVGITFIYVTHDQDEALLLSDRIAVFRDGGIDQVGTAQELYERPTTRFVASFFGDSNILEGQLDDTDGTVRLEQGMTLRTAKTPTGRVGDRVAVVLRPERVRVLAPGADRAFANRLSGTATDVRYLGNARKVEVTTPAGQMLAWGPADQLSSISAGDRLDVGWNPDDCTLITADVAPRAVPDAEVVG
jgi:putative spermidine/putrescine transport system ATP-binding protein